ncbi:unnamed protein product [Rotaria socialis]|nr:unnamed protein product [Rotaria socialis]
MAASWLRINELFSSNADLVCIVGRTQSINSIQGTIVLHDDATDDDCNEISPSSSTLHVSFANLRRSFDFQSSNFQRGQYIQVYGKVVRQGANIIRVEAQLIRQLDFDFDLNEYVKGLLLTRNYMTNVDSSTIDNEDLIDNSGNAIRTIL